MKNLVNRNQLPTVILICLGVVIAVVGLITMTVARGNSQVEAKMVTPSTPYVITREGVFELSSTPMTITAEASNPQADVTLVVGRSSDIYGWLGTAAYTEVAGLKSWEELYTEVTDGDRETSSEKAEADPAKADMWVKVLQGKGKVSFSTTEKTAGMAVLATTDGDAKAPALSLSWNTPSTLIWRVSLLILGLILIVAGTVLLWFTKQKNLKLEAAEVEIAEESNVASAENTLQETEEETQEETTEETSDEVAEVVETDAQALTALEEEPERPRKHGAVIETVVGSRTIKFPSRQAIKEARLRGESVIEVDGHAFQTGLIPVVKKVNDVVESELPME